MNNKIKNILNKYYLHYIVLITVVFILIMFFPYHSAVKAVLFGIYIFFVLNSITLFEQNKSFENALKEKDKKTQEEIEEKTKELEAMTQLLTAKNKELEKRNYELQKQELTALKIMEEMDISNWKLKRQSQILEDAKAQLEQRTKELTILYELSNSIGYITDYENLFTTIFNSITKASKLYAVSMFILTDNKKYFFTSVPQYKEKILDKILNDVINALKPLTQETIKPEDIKIEFFKLNSKNLTKLLNENENEIITSNFPILHKGKLKGIFSLTIPSYYNFSDNELKIFQTIVNHIASAINNIEELIKKETAKMDMMVKSMVDGIIMTNMRGEVIIINPAAKKILGIKKDLIDQNSIEDGAKYFQILELMKKLQHDGKETLSKTIKIEKPRTRFINAEISTVKSDDGTPLGIVAILRDITKMKELDEMKSDFVSTVSHELRTPLSSIKEAVSLVFDETVGQINETQKKCLKIAKDEVERLSRLINDVLDISKLESGKADMHFSNVEIPNLFKKTINTLKHKLDKKQIKTVLNAPQELTITADEDKLMQVLINLVDNAVKFTPEKGKIELTAEILDDKVKISVKDNGIGIHPQDIENIFDKFKQVSTGIKRKTGGTGLGLAICKKIIELHNGEIGVDSEIEKGSTFWFIIPIYQK